MNPWDQPDGEGRGDISELPCGFPAQGPPTTGAARTGTYPSCRRGRTHRTRGPAPRTRSQFAVAASLASCELCAAGGALGAPSRSAWVPGRGWGASAAGVLLSVAERLWGWSGRGESQRRGTPDQSFIARGRGWLGSRERKGEVGASGAAGAHSPARSVRAPRTIARWLGGDTGTVALAALALRAGAVLALEPLPGRSASARSPSRSPSCAARGRPPGALSAPPRPAPPLPIAASFTSKFGGGSPPAMHPCFRESRAQGGPMRAGGTQAGHPGPTTLAASGLNVGPPGGELSTGTFSPTAGACVWEAVAPPFSSPPARNLTLLPSTCTPPLRSTRWCTPPFPR